MRDAELSPGNDAAICSQQNRRHRGMRATQSPCGPGIPAVSVLKREFEVVIEHERHPPSILYVQSPLLSLALKAFGVRVIVVWHFAARVGMCAAAA